jgi:hypothetical protein
MPPDRQRAGAHRLIQASRTTLTALRMQRDGRVVAGPVTCAAPPVRARRGHSKRFAFVETNPDLPSGGEPGLNAFLKDASLSATATQEEIEFLKRLRVKGKRPTPLYYYRELQNLRDPLRFRTVER